MDLPSIRPGFSDFFARRASFLLQLRLREMRTDAGRSVSDDDDEEPRIAADHDDISRLKVERAINKPPEAPRRRSNTKVV